MLIISLSYFLFSSYGQTTTATYPKIQVKFINELKEPVSNLPVEVTLRGAPRSMYHVTDENGLIKVPLVIYDHYAKDTVYSCGVNVVHNDYQYLSQEIKLPKDSLKMDYVKTIRLQKMTPVKLIEDQFENLTGLISLNDLANKDTLFLYQSYIKPVPSALLGPTSIKLVKLSENIFRLDLYGYDNQVDRHYKLEKLVKIKLKKRKVTILLDGVKFKFYLKPLRGELEYGNEHRFMLIRR